MPGLANIAFLFVQTPSRLISSSERASKVAARGGSVSQVTFRATSGSNSPGCDVSQGLSGGTSLSVTRFHGPDQRLALTGIHSPTRASVGTTISTEVVKLSSGMNTYSEGAVRPVIRSRSPNHAQDV